MRFCFLALLVILPGEHLANIDFVTPPAVMVEDTQFSTAQARSFVVILSGGSGDVVDMAKSTHVKYTLRNPSDFERTVLIWNTPLEKQMLFDAFAFSQNVSSLYIGALAKRLLAITEQTTITLPAGGEISNSIDLLRYYHFHSSANGTIQAKHPIWEVVGTSHVLTSQVESNALRFTVPDEVSSSQLPEELFSLAYTHKCSVSQSRTIMKAINDAKKMIECEKELGFEDRHHYFGPRDAAPAKVGRILNRAYERLVADAFEVTCHKATKACGDEGYTFACVWPADPHHQINVASQFWIAVQNSEYGKKLLDTQAGTLIHELTHFQDVGATLDLGYGDRKLPPNDAIRNADTYEYFCETCMRDHPDWWVYWWYNHEVAIIIGLVVGGILILACCTCCTVCLCRKCKKSRLVEEFSEPLTGA